MPDMLILTHWLFKWKFQVGSLIHEIWNSDNLEVSLKL